MSTRKEKKSKEPEVKEIRPLFAAPSKPALVPTSNGKIYEAEIDLEKEEGPIFKYTSPSIVNAN